MAPSLSLSLFGLVTIALSFTILQLIRGAFPYDRATFNQKVISLKGSATNPDFLPIWAHNQPRPMDEPVAAGMRPVKIIDWSAERRVFSIESGPVTDVRLKTYYYPYWIAAVDTRQLITKPADEDGALLITVPAENARIEVKFTEPYSTSIAGGISLCALLVIFLLLASKPRLARFAEG